MKLCESCRYRNNTEYEKPCIVYRDDCEFYEKEGDMTREEAIKELQESHDIMRSYDIDESESRLMTALDMAIKALEQEPCKDAISRQAVLDAIDVKAWEFCDYLISKNRNDEQKPVSHFADNLRECVREELPSVTPQPKTGHWITTQEVCRFLVDYMDILETQMQEPKTGHCKGCKYFEYDSVAKVEGIPLIVAH